MKTRTSKQLRLRRETIRDLTPGTMRQIAGATTLPCDLTTTTNATTVISPATTVTTATNAVGDAEKFVNDEISLVRSDLLGNCGFSGCLVCGTGI